MSTPTPTPTGHSAKPAKMRSSSILHGDFSSLQDRDHPNSAPGKAGGSNIMSNVPGKKPREKEKGGKEIRVGTFMCHGKKKEYAIVPNALIKDDLALKELMKFWKLDDPNFIVELSASKKARKDIIAKEDTVYMLQKMFLADKDKPRMENPLEKKEKDNWLETLKNNEVPLHPFYRPEKVARVESEGREEAKEDEEESKMIEEEEEAKEMLEKRKKVIPAEDRAKSSIESMKATADKNSDKGDGRQRGSESDYLPMINRHVQRKSVLALKSVVSAADMNNGWFLCQGEPTANERMLESAIDRTNSTRLKIIVVDGLARYNTHEERENKKKTEDKKKVEDNSILYFKQKLEEHSKTMKEAKEAVEGKEAVKIEAANKGKDGDEQGKRISFFSDASSLDQSLSEPSAPQRITTMSFPQYRSSDSSLWDIQQDDLYDVKWQATWPWVRGTHYIFSDDYSHFDAQKLGRHGYICLNGESAQDSKPKTTGYVIREAVSISIRPCLLFNNTGSETQAYAQLINRIREEDERMRESKEPRTMIYQAKKHINNSLCSCFRAFPCFSLCCVRWCTKEEDQREASSCLPLFKSSTVDKDSKLGRQVNEKSHYDKLQTDLHQKAWSLHRYAIEGCSDAGKLLTVDHVLNIVDHYCSSPSLFRSVVIPVDPLNDEPDDIAKQLMMSFARADLERKEVGAGNADKNAVERAWRLHHQLNRSKRWKGMFRNILYSCYIVAGILTTAVSILGQWLSKIKAEINIDKNACKDNEQCVAQWTAFALAAMVSVCAGILNLSKFDSHLGRIQTAQAKIVYELFQFRMRVGKYSVIARERELEEAKAKTTAGEKGEKKRNEPSSEEQREDVITNKSTAMHEARTRFSQALSFIFQELSSLDLYYDTLAQGELAKGDRQELLDYVSDSLHLSSNRKVADETIISGPMIPEEYYKIRVLPFLKHLEKQEDKIRWKTRGLQICSMLCSSAAMILGAAGVVEAIPVIVALATGLFQALKVMDYERRFEVISSAARETGALDAYWESLSPLDRWVASTRIHLVRTCEQLALQFETTSVIQVDKEHLALGDNNEVSISSSKANMVRNAT